MARELKIDFFKINYNRIEPRAGLILIAEPGLIDQYFKRSVILLVEHNPKGSVGFVLNRSLDFRLPELLPDFPDFNAKVSIGGPVSPSTIHFVHILGNKIPGSKRVSDGLYWGGDLDFLKSLIIANSITPHQVRFFIGYSGWSKEQLEGEIAEESLVVAHFDAVQIMAGSDDLWRRAVQQLGTKFKPWTIYPENPTLN